MRQHAPRPPRSIILTDIPRRNALLLAGLAAGLGLAGCGPEQAVVASSPVAVDDFEAGSFEVPAATGDADQDTANIVATIAATRANTESGVAGGHIVFPAGEWVIDDTIDLIRFSGLLTGQGTGNSPAHTVSPGSATVIRWAGPSSKSMFLLRDYDRVVFENLRLEGNNRRPPKYAIESRWRAGDTHGSGANLIVRNCVIGQYPWSTQGTHVGRVSSGIGFTGENGNNDEFLITKTSITGCEVGIDLPNTQSVWGAFDSVFVGSATVAGVRSASSFTATNLTFDNCATDVALSSTARPTIHGWWSERSECIFDQADHSGFSVRGGLWLIGDRMAGKASLNAARRIDSDFSLEGVQVVYNTGERPKLSLIGASASRPYHVSIRNCLGLEFATLDVQGHEVPGHMFIDISTGGIQLATTVRRRQLTDYVHPTRTDASYDLSDGEIAPLICDGRSVVVNLPPLGQCRPGATRFLVKNVNESPVTITPRGGRIDGVGSRSLGQWESVSLFTDGSDWYTT